MFGLSPALSEEERLEHVKGVFKDCDVEEVRHFFLLLARLNQREFSSLARSVENQYCSYCGAGPFGDPDEAWPCQCEDKDRFSDVDFAELANLFSELDKDTILLLSTHMRMFCGDKEFWTLYRVYEEIVEPGKYIIPVEPVETFKSEDAQLALFRMEAMALARKLERSSGIGHASRIAEIEQVEDLDEMARIRDELFTKQSRRAWWKRLFRD